MQPLAQNSAGTDHKTAALTAVAAAAALRSESVLWRALEEAMVVGASFTELEEVIQQAARMAEAAVRQDGLRVLKEVRVHLDTDARWRL